MAVLLRERGWEVSTSMVGRILSHLKARGVLKEPLRNGISTRKRLWRRTYAVRKPKGYEVKRPGDLVQVDTLDIRPLPGMVLKHFTARDVVSRWDVGPHQSHFYHCGGLLGAPPGADALPCKGHPSGWWL